MKKFNDEIYELFENGADMVEIFEYVEENTDLDPAEVVDYLFKRSIK